jgi:hypothetical protein
MPIMRTPAQHARQAAMHEDEKRRWKNVRYQRKLATERAHIIWPTKEKCQDIGKRDRNAAHTRNRVDVNFTLLIRLIDYLIRPENIPEYRR